MSKNDLEALQMKLSQQQLKIEILQTKVAEIWGIVTNSPTNCEQREELRKLAYQVLDNQPKESFIKIYGEKHEAFRHPLVDELLNTMWGDMSKLITLAKKQLEDD